MAKKSTRTVRKFTPEEQEHWENAKNEELEGMAENIAAAKKRKEQALLNRPQLVLDILMELNQLKHESNISLSELSDRTDMSRSSLSRLLNNGVNPQLQTLETIAKAMGKRVVMSLVDDE